MRYRIHIGFVSLKDRPQRECWFIREDFAKSAATIACIGFDERAGQLLPTSARKWQANASRFRAERRQPIESWLRIEGLRQVEGSTHDLALVVSHAAICELPHLAGG